MEENEHKKKREAQYRQFQKEKNLSYLEEYKHESLMVIDNKNGKTFEKFVPKKRKKLDVKSLGGSIVNCSILNSIISMSGFKQKTQVEIDNLNYDNEINSLKKQKEKLMKEKITQKIAHEQQIAKLMEKINKFENSKNYVEKKNCQTQTNSFFIASMQKKTNTSLTFTDSKNQEDPKNLKNKTKQIENVYFQEQNKQIMQQQSLNKSLQNNNNFQEKKTILQHSIFLPGKNKLKKIQEQNEKRDVNLQKTIEAIFEKSNNHSHQIIRKFPQLCQAIVKMEEFAMLINSVN